MYILTGTCLKKFRLQYCKQVRKTHFMIFIRLDDIFEGSSVAKGGAQGAPNHLSPSLDLNVEKIYG